MLGTFAIYQPEIGSPTPLQQSLTEQFTHIASIAIERAQTEAALRRSEAFLMESQRLGAVQDVTERWLSEDALSKIRSELAHVSRVTTLELERLRTHPWNPLPMVRL